MGSHFLSPTAQATVTRLLAEVLDTATESTANERSILEIANTLKKIKDALSEGSRPVEREGQLLVTNLLGWLPRVTRMRTDEVPKDAALLVHAACMSRRAESPSPDTTLLSIAIFDVRNWSVLDDLVRPSGRFAAIASQDAGPLRIRLYKRLLNWVVGELATRFGASDTDEAGSKRDLHRVVMDTPGAKLTFASYASMLVRMNGFLFTMWNCRLTKTNFMFEFPSASDEASALGTSQHPCERRLAVFARLVYSAYTTSSDEDPLLAEVEPDLARDIETNEWPNANTRRAFRHILKHSCWNKHPALRLRYFIQMYDSACASFDLCHGLSDRRAERNDEEPFQPSYHLLINSDRSFALFDAMFGAWSDSLKRAHDSI